MDAPRFTPEMFEPPSKEVVKEWQDKLINKYLLDNDKVRAELNDDQIISRDIIPKTTRVLLPNQPCTMDFIPGRMNIQLDNDKKVISVYFC